jgi:lipoprotein signal peptidase
VNDPFATAVCTAAAVDVPQACNQFMLVGVGWALGVDVEITMEVLAVGVGRNDGAAERLQALNSTVAVIATAMIIIVFLDMLFSSEIACN